MFTSNSYFSNGNSSQIISLRFESTVCISCHSAKTLWNGRLSVSQILQSEKKEIIAFIICRVDY